MLQMKQAARAMGLSERTLRRWRASGKINHEARPLWCWCGRLVWAKPAEHEDGIADHYEGLCECGTYCGEVVP